MMIASTESAIGVLVVAAVAVTVGLIIRSRRLSARSFAEQLDSLASAVLALASRYDDLLSFSAGYLMKKDYDQLRTDAAPVVAKLLKVPAVVSRKFCKLPSGLAPF